MRVLVYGATGLAGSLIARALLDGGKDVILSGRDPGRLRALARRLGVPDTRAAVRPAPVHDTRALAAAMDGADLVLMCAGPLARIGEPVLAAAVDAGLPYADLAVEQAFARDIYERYEAQARHAGVVAVSGLGCVGALGDLAAHLVAAHLLAAPDDDEGAVALTAAEDDVIALAAAEDEVAVADEITVTYALLHHARMAAGARRAVVENVAAPGSVWAGDRWDPALPFAERRVVDLGPELGEHAALSYPSLEVITVPRHAPASRVQTYLALPATGALADATARLASVVTPIVHTFLGAPLAAYARALAGARPAAPTDAERAHARFALVAEATRGARRARLCVRGGDPYAVTAALVALAAEPLVSAGAALAGVRAPAEVLDPASALAALADTVELAVEPLPGTDPSIIPPG